MIHEIGLELAAKLVAIGVPFAVVDGPEGTKTITWGRERIVLEHDDANDSFGPPRSQHQNPKHRYTRTAAYKLTIYAQSRTAGATLFEHRRRASRALDRVLVAMDSVAADRKNRWKPGAGRFVTPEDLKDTERANGAVYELSFTFDHAVEVRTWAGAALPESALTAVTSRTQVSLLNEDTPSAETACGA